MNNKSAESCVFCRIVRRELTPGVLAFCDDHTAVFPSLHQQPGNRGHMLVVPVHHVAHIYAIGADVAGPLMMTVARVAAAVKLAWDAHGVSVRQNNEPHGGQDVFHVHFHVIPRFEGDRFDRGDNRFPHGALEVLLSERIEQAARLSRALRQVETPAPGDAG